MTRDRLLIIDHLSEFYDVGGPFAPFTVLHISRNPTMHKRGAIYTQPLTDLFP
jgi:hypothetical protein